MTKLNLLHLGLNEFFDRKSDIIYGLYHAFRTLGYDTTVSHNEIKGKRLNLIIGSDVIAGDSGAMETFLGSGVDFGVYEVENYNGTTINYRRNFNNENYMRLIAESKIVITPYIYNLRALANVCDPGKLHYAKWGFHECMQNQNVSRSSDPEFLACFFGLIKGSRISKKDELLKYHPGRIKFICQDDPFSVRDYTISQSKFGLSLSYGSTDDFANPFRLNYMAANGVSILSDHENDEDGYNFLCEHSSFEQLLQNLSSNALNPRDVIDRAQSSRLTDGLRGIL